jgi:hypothetical protein
LDRLVQLDHVVSMVVNALIGVNTLTFNIPVVAPSVSRSTDFASVRVKDLHFIEGLDRRTRPLPHAPSYGSSAAAMQCSAIRISSAANSSF